MTLAISDRQRYSAAVSRLGWPSTSLCNLVRFTTGQYRGAVSNRWMGSAPEFTRRIRARRKGSEEWRPYQGRDPLCFPALVTAQAARGSSLVQKAQRLAACGTFEMQNGHSRVLGPTGSSVLRKSISRLTGTTMRK